MTGGRRRKSASPERGGSPTRRAGSPSRRRGEHAAQQQDWRQVEVSWELRSSGSDGTNWHTAWHGIPDPVAVCQDISLGVQRLLYASPDQVPGHFPTLAIVVEGGPDVQGVAWTCEVTVSSGGGRRWKQKEIHLVHAYFQRLEGDRAAWWAEVQGVLWHEMVHVWQHNALGTLDGGLIEGIADYVRLMAGFAPAHWRRGPGGRWNEGYAGTAHFLAWVAERLRPVHPPDSSPDFVQRLNHACAWRRWKVGMWEELTGIGVSEWWDAYQQALHGLKTAPPPQPTHAHP